MKHHHPLPSNWPSIIPEVCDVLMTFTLFYTPGSSSPHLRSIIAIRGAVGSAWPMHRFGINSASMHRCASELSDSSVSEAGAQNVTRLGGLRGNWHQGQFSNIAIELRMLWIWQTSRCWFLSHLNTTDFSVYSSLGLLWSVGSMYFASTTANISKWTGDNLSHGKQVDTSCWSRAVGCLYGLSFLTFELPY